jgi:hypothetical protein
MRVSPAIRVKGRIAREVSGVRKTLTTAVCGEIAKAGRQHACTIDTLIYPEPEIPTSRTWSGLSSNDGSGSNRLPARSDGLDNFDGGPDAAFYIQLRVIEQVSIGGGF